MDETTQSARQPEPAPRTGVTLQRPAIVAILYLLNVFVGFSVFVGLVLAYVWRGEAETQAWEKTHYSYLIRTFWIGLAVFVASFVLLIGSMVGLAFDQAGRSDPPDPGFFLGFFGMIGVWLMSAVWFCIRCVLSLVKSSDGKPMPRPGTWLF